MALDSQLVQKQAPARAAPLCRSPQYRSTLQTIGMVQIMSGIRDHRLYVVTVEGVKVTHERVQDSCGGSDLTGRILRTPAKHTQNIIASLPAIAVAHVSYWLPFSEWDTETTKVTVDEGTQIDAFIHHLQY